MNTGDQNYNEVYSLSETPWYFGAYLNMARHNVYLVSNEISKKLNLDKELKEDEHIPNSFLTDNNFIDKNIPNLLYTNIVRYLPVVKVFSSDLLSKEVREDAEFQGVDTKNMTCFLKSAFKEINAFRNDYSHFYLANGYTRKVTVEEDLVSFLIMLFNYAISYTKARFKNILPDSSFKFVEKTIANQLIQNNTISTRGFVFFCNLFLDKENAFHFFNKVMGLKDTRKFEFLATREVFTVFCLKLPHDKFVSDNPNQALQLDILNYLNRVPRELYNVLTEEAKKQFQPHLDDLKKGNIEENSIGENIEEDDYEEYIRAISTLKRSEDRFTEFALKYLDQSDTFRFNFQIHLGKSEIRSYKKSFLDITPDKNNRTITKDIKTFGKLSTFVDNQNDIKEKIIEEKDFKKLFTGDDFEYFTQYAPKYHIANNKIGLLSYENKTYYGKYYRPVVSDVFISLNELPKMVLLDILGKEKITEIINKLENTKIYNIRFIEKIKNIQITKEIINEFIENNSTKIYNIEFIEKIKNIQTTKEIINKLENTNIHNIEFIKKIKNRQTIEEIIKEFIDSTNIHNIEFIEKKIYWLLKK